MFITGELEKDVKIIGEIRVCLFVSSQNYLTDFSVSVLDIHPDRSAYNVVSTTHRCDIKTKRINKFDLTVGSTAMTFKRGHSVGLRIALSNFSHCDIIRENIRVYIWFGGKYSSYLLLPRMCKY